MNRARRALGLGLGLACAAPSTGRAWDGPTTHAGLTEQAALASSLGQRLAETLGRPLGLYETLALPTERAPADSRLGRIGHALSALDGAEGYAPQRGRLPAVAWLVAGSVVEEVPADRVGAHFAPGVRQGGFLEGMRLRFAAAAAGRGSLRGALSGGPFDGDGPPSTVWLDAPDNDLSLTRFLDARERAVAAPTRAERDAALAEALLVAGALLHVVEDAAEPALAHGDVRSEFTDGEHGGEAGTLRRWAALRYGRLGLPAAGDVAPRTVAHLADLIHASDGSGLADRTARRFPSWGTLPDARWPIAGGPSLTAGAQSARAVGYVSSSDAPHLARYARDGEGHVAWSLDERCHADAARVLLPEAAAAARAALEHLFRGALTIANGSVRVGGATALGAGTLRVLVEDAAGGRRLVGEKRVAGAAVGEALGDLAPGGAADATAFGGARRVVAVYRGVDGNGEPIAASAELALAPQ